MDATALLNEADACHDDDPARAAGLIDRIDPAALDRPQWPRLGFLLVHVHGERLGHWGRAHRSLQAWLAGTTEPPALLWRHAAVAAQCAREPEAAAAATSRYARAAGADVAQAAELVALAAIAFELAAWPAAEAGARVHAALAPLDGTAWLSPGALDAAAAAQCNNIGSHLVDRPLPDLAVPALRAALAASAAHAARLWQRAGTWVNHERALYLRALASSALGDAVGALVHAQQALALLAANDPDGAERVDRAFLQLEASFALQRLGRATEAAAQRAQADGTAAGFGEPGLTRWFADRAARNTALAAGQPG
jgi:hypothetical protein